MPATIYLNADTGNDTTGNGSSGNPYLTIGKAHSVGVNGDTVVLQDSVAPYLYDTRTLSKVLSFIGESREGCILDGGGADVQWTFANNCLFRNLTFQNIHGASDRGFMVGFGNPPLQTFDACVFRDITFLADGNYVAGFYNVSADFYGCLFDDLHPSGAGGDHGLFGTTNGTYDLLVGFYNCIFHFKTSGVQRLHRLAYEYVGSAYVRVTSKNSIFYNVSGGTIYWVSGWNNLGVGECDYSCNYLMTNVPSGDGNITLDPKFISPDTGNFFLADDSPCLSAGVPL